MSEWEEVEIGVCNKREREREKRCEKRGGERERRGVKIEGERGERWVMDNIVWLYIIYRVNDWYIYELI